MIENVIIQSKGEVRIKSSIIHGLFFSYIDVNHINFFGSFFVQE
jgi:hypothetical protein